MEEINSQIKVEPPLQVVSPLKPKLSFKIPLLAVFVVTMMGLSAGVTYLILKFPTPTQNSQPIVQNTPAPFVKTSPASSFSGFAAPRAQGDETADWKTYTNKEYRFSFKYPSDWLISEINRDTFSQMNLIKTDSSQEKVLLPGNTKTDATYEINVRVEQNPKKLAIRDYLLQNISEESKKEVSKNFQDIVIGNVPAIKYKQACGPCSGMGTTIASVKGDFVYSLTYGANAYPETHEKYMTVFTQIISTFKFLD